MVQEMVHCMVAHCSALLPARPSSKRIHLRQAFSQCSEGTHLQAARPLIIRSKAANAPAL